MKNSKFLRSALIALLCLAILGGVTGGTIAWFTDTVEVTNNVIKSGNLDMVVEYKTDWNEDWAELKEDTNLFDEEALYEPGYTEVVFLRISNAGNLAFKYNLAVSVADIEIGKSVLGNDIHLSDYMEMGIYVQDEYSSGFNYADIFIPNMFDTREKALDNVTMTSLKDQAPETAENLITLYANSPVLPGEQTAQVIALVLNMPTTVGNEANHVTGTDAPKTVLGIHAVATQYTSEDDAFDNQYDKDATYPETEVIHPNAPKADVEADFDVTMPFVEFDLANWKMGEEKQYKLEALLTYTATEEDPKAAGSEYWHWNGDFSVSVDKPVPAGVIGLAGKYGDYAFAFDVTNDLCNMIEEGSSVVPANTEFRLLAPFDFAVNYQEICQNVKEFICGVYFTEYATEEQKAALKGTTITVKLNLYETMPPYDSGAANPDELPGGQSMYIGKYDYKF